MTTVDRPAPLVHRTAPRTTSGPAPLVSVVMPVRNEARSVVAAVTSVLEQTVSDLEVLVVDGSSTDGTADAVRELAARHPRVRLLDNPHRTIPHALNVGRAAARGRYVARVDAHARVSSTYLERAVAELERAPDVAAVGGLRIGVAATPVGRAVAAALSSRFGVGGSLNHYATDEQDTDHASFGVYRRQVLERVDGWDEDLIVNEDVDLDHRILRSGHRIRFDPEMHILWEVRESLRDFGRQYRRYGRGKAAMVRKNGPTAVRARHLVAPALVVSLGGAAALAAGGHPGPLIAVSASYAAAVAGVSSVLSRQERPPGEQVRAGRLAGAFVVMHLSWGLGFLEGLVAGRVPAPSSAR